VLNAACMEAAAWPGKHPASQLTSRRFQFRSQTLALNVAGAPPPLPVFSAARLELEITEAVLIRDDEAALATMHQFASAGCADRARRFRHRLFFAELSAAFFPFDKIKIDRSFIKGIADEGASSAIVAGGGEHRRRQQHDDGRRKASSRSGSGKLLRELGCNEMQGYLFSPAIPATDVRRLLFFASRQGRCPPPDAWDTCNCARPRAIDNRQDRQDNFVQ